MMIPIETGKEISWDSFLIRLVENLYERNDIQFKQGCFRVRGETVDIFPAYMETAIRVEFWGDEVERIRSLDPLTGETGQSFEQFHLYPANQFITPRDKMEKAIGHIRLELDQRVDELDHRIVPKDTREIPVHHIGLDHPGGGRARLRRGRGAPAGAPRRDRLTQRPQGFVQGSMMHLPSTHSPSQNPQS